MPSIVDSCRKAQTLRAFLDSPAVESPEASSAAAETAAHLLLGCSSCRKHLEASLPQPGVPGRVAAALQALSPKCPSFGRLWYVDRPTDAEPPPELREGLEESSSEESPSKAAYLKGVTRYCRSLAGREMPDEERFAEARRVLSHLIASCRNDLTVDEWRELLLQAAVAAGEAALLAGDGSATDRYNELLLFLLEHTAHPDIGQATLAVYVLRPWCTGDIETLRKRLKEMYEEVDKEGTTAWRTCLAHLLTGEPLEVMKVLDEMAPEEAPRSAAARQRFEALGVLTRASLLALPVLPALRKAG